ncbi:MULTISPECIES: carbohydrate ABC transporter permease [Eisenbergiella]|uniref:Sugar ABC transporter permease n=1 Tax=Eisenbergiella porci TaxID=2652274 RepID=A0A6N7W894_9FIRM|nr:MULTISPECIES: sugar ABC transporter permease [Eisenbergiella]MSS90782.1 sugar ABC transporter permease [Eisenbergiella porci]
MKGKPRTQQKQHRSRRAFLAFLLPSFLGVAVFVLVPFIDVFRRSFTTAVTGEFTGLENYRTIFENGPFRLAVYNTLRFTCICLPLLLILGLAAALMLSQLKQVQLFKSFFLLPMAMPSATIVLVWKMTFSADGFLNRLLETHVDFMWTEDAFWVLVFSYVWKNLGYTVILWLAGILAIPGDFIEAARVDGAGSFRVFWSVMLPQLKGSMYTITVLSFLNSFKVFRESYLVAGAYPHESMYMLQHLFNNWFTYLDLDKMAAAAVCVGGVLLIVILLLQRLWDGGDEQ